MRVLICLLLLGAIEASDVIEGEYLLGLKPEYDSGVFASRLKHEFGLQLKKVWDIKRTKIMHLSGDGVDIQSLAELSEVKYVSNNGWMHLHQSNATCQVTAHPSVWGLDRTDQREALPYSLPTDPRAVYNHGMATGLGVNAYVTDTGIDITHSTFEGRAIWGYNAEGIPGEEDGYGHGTHCAGTIGGLEYGVAKEVTPIAVKVVADSGAGTVAQFIDGLAWVQQQHVPGVDRSVVSASLGYTGDQPPLQDIIAQMFIEGINFAVSAGNDDGDSCQQSPAKAPECNTAAAVDVNDNTASFTNYGSCVDIHAPGVDVLSSVPNEGTDYYSGTSMAAPHVAGVIARYLSSTSGSPPTPEAVSTWLADMATQDAVIFSDPDHASSPNLLLFADCALVSPK